MYGRTFGNPKKYMWQTCHVYEQVFGDIPGLPALKNFPSIFPKHWWSCLTGESVKPYKVFQNSRFEIINCCFSAGRFFIGPTIFRKWSATEN